MEALKAFLSMENMMTHMKSLMVALVAAATLATPALARENHVARKAADSYASVAADTCVRAPNVGAFASNPWQQPPCEPNTGF